MKAFGQVLGGIVAVCTISAPAMAAAVAAPGPEIGTGVAGAIGAAVALLALLVFPRLKRMLQSK